MKSDFDEAALTYDHDFTYSSIGKAQRNQVWKYLDKYLNNKDKLRILELNCGTGEDAKRFADRGYLVTATDVSDMMLKQAQSKSVGKEIYFQKLDFNEIESFDQDEKFDLVFSNFGGLNCIDPEVLKRVNTKISTLVNQGGSFIAVVMPDFCFWESIYFMLKRKWGEVFRRSGKYAMANVSNEQVKTFYFSPSKFQKLSPLCFKRELLKPIGLFIPPSYLEEFFKKRPGLLKMFQNFDRLTAHFSWQAYLSDHYYIQFSIK